MKLFVSDLDGTLLNKEFQISKANVRAIEELHKKGIRFAAATGRIYRDAAAIFQNQGLNPYIIASNGACIFDRDGNQLYGRWMTYSDLKETIAYLEKNQVCYGIGTSREYLTTYGWEETLDCEVKRLRCQDIVVPDHKVAFAKHETAAQNGFREMDIRKAMEDRSLTCYSISVVTYDEKKIRLISEFVNKRKNLAATVAGSHSLEIMSREGTKGHAVKYLADFLKIEPKDIGAIGDSHNDISMLQYANVSVAMGNAEDRIKQMCRFTTKDCMADGFAHAVMKLTSFENMEEQHDFWI